MPPPNQITGMSFDDRGDYLITAAEDECFKLWNCKTGKSSKVLYSRKYGVDLPRFLHTSSTIVYASTKEDDTVRYHSLHDNKFLQYFRGHTQKVISLEVSPQADTIMSGSLDNTVRLWDVRTPLCRGLLHTPSTPIVAYDNSGMVFAVALNGYNRICLYDQNNFDKEPFLTIHLDDISLNKISFPPRIPFISSLSFSSNGKWLLVGTSSNCHYILDAFDGALLAKLVGFTGLEGGKGPNHAIGVVPAQGISGEELTWTPDSKFIISGTQEGKLVMWDISPESGNDKKLIATPQGSPPFEMGPSITLDGHPGPTRCVKFNPRLAMMATAGLELAFWLPDTGGVEGEVELKKPYKTG
ncbi:WD40 repeat-like protein [Sistotremastrum suecicum HHB10207 ss-3]|nr:WD40 repeat-like protein [Sistotremastrum suecicum HHB10207 ss-3]